MSEEPRILTNDLHRQLGPIIRTRRHILDFPEREHAVDDFAEDDVFAVKKVAFGGGDEELLTMHIVHQ